MLAHNRCSISIRTNDPLSWVTSCVFGWSFARLFLYPSSLDAMFFWAGVRRTSPSAPCIHPGWPHLLPCLSSSSFPWGFPAPFSSWNPLCSPSCLLDISILMPHWHVNYLLPLCSLSQQEEPTPTQLCKPETWGSCLTPTPLDTCSLAPLTSHIQSLISMDSSS